MIDMNQALNLMRVYEANIVSMDKCRIDFHKLISPEELTNITNFACNELTKLSKWLPKVVTVPDDQKFHDLTLVKLHVGKKAT